jgi:hypothetical protein
MTEKLSKLDYSSPAHAIIMAAMDGMVPEDTEISVNLYEGEASEWISDIARGVSRLSYRIERDGKAHPCLVNAWGT